MGLPQLADDLLHIFVLGPGYGESILIRLPDGGWVVVDSYDSPSFGPVSVLDHYGASTAAIVLTHPHMDHAGGFSRVLGRHQTGPIGCRPPTRGRVAADDLVSQLRGRQASSVLAAIASRWDADPQSRFILETGARIELGSLRLEALWPPVRDIPSRDLNHWSSPLFVTWQRLRVLLGADLPASSWNQIPSRLRKRLPRHHILKIPHHGSRGAYSVSYAQAPRSRRLARTWVMTPWLHGAGRLPLFNDSQGVDLLLRHESEIHLTSPASTLPEDSHGKDRSFRRAALTTEEVVQFGAARIGVRPPRADPTESWVAFAFSEMGKLEDATTGGEALRVLA